MSGKTTNGQLQSSKTSSGIGNTENSLEGGSAGTVPYQSDVNITTFSNATNGVLENISNVVNFSSSPTTISTITAPSATDLSLIAPAAKKIKLTATSGDLEFSNNNGSTLPLTITGGTLKTLINSSPFLTTSGTGVIQTGTVLATTNGGTGNANGTIDKTTVLSSPFLTTTAGGVIQTGTVLATTNGGTGNANGTIANLSGGSSGTIAYQSAANITTFSNSGNGVLQSLSGTPAFTGTLSTVNQISVSSTPFSLNNNSLGLAININTNYGEIILSSDNGITRQLVALPIGVQLGQYANANFLYTDGSGLVGAGTILPTTSGGTGNANGTIDKTTVLSSPFLTTTAGGVIQTGTVLGTANGGTGVSSIVVPKTTQYAGSGSITLTGVCKYFTVEAIGAGGGGGGGDASSGGGGGGGGTFAVAHYAYNAGAGYYTYVCGAGGTAGAAGANGGTGGTTSFSANGVSQFTITGSSGGQAGQAGSLPGNGGVPGSTNNSKSFFGSYGSPGSTLYGGSGGGSCRGGGETTNNGIISGNQTGRAGIYYGSGGCGGTGTGAGGAGYQGCIFVTEYYP